MSFLEQVYHIWLWYGGIMNELRFCVLISELYFQYSLFLCNQPNFACIVLVRLGMSDDIWENPSFCVTVGPYIFILNCKMSSLVL